MPKASLRKSNDLLQQLKLKLKAKVWLYPVMAGWHFLSLPEKESAQIREKFKLMQRGWGSLPVSVTIGKTTWKTSIFPDKKTKSYLFPLKADVRKKEKISEGDVVAFSLDIQP